MTTDDERREQAPTSAILPWEGRPARADVIILLAFAVNAVTSLALLPLIPSMLAHHALRLELIGGSSVATVTVGAHARLGEIALPLAVVAGVPALMMFDWAYWWAGRRWGDRGLTLLLGGGGRRGPAAAGRRAARLERVAGRFGPAGVLLAYFLPVPSALVYAAAGMAGMRLLVFLLLDVLGTTLWVSLMVAVGYTWGRGAIAVVHRVDHYALWITLALLVLVVLVGSARARTGSRYPGGPSSMDRRRR